MWRGLTVPYVSTCCGGLLGIHTVSLKLLSTINSRHCVYISV